MSDATLHVEPHRAIALHVAEADSPTLSVGGEVYASDVPEYDGEYEARALFSEQVFGTARKKMRGDFTVRAINYTEAPNEYGTTLTIGG